MVLGVADVDARTRMIEAAERLVAERGVHGVSLREVGAAAGQRNNSAAQYHFGDRAGLVAAVFEHRMVPIDVRRVGLLAELEAADRLDVRGLVEAFVRPFADALDLADGATSYARFTAAVLDVPELADVTAPERPWMSGLRRTFALLADRLDHLPADLADERLRLAATLVVHALADRERRRAAGHPVPTSPTVLTADLVDAVCGLLLAPTHMAVPTAAPRTEEP
jgi:AcrR family transcriptional regulator